MEYNRWKAIKAVDAEYKAGKISQKQHARKVASIRKAYAEYEAQWVANMKAQYAQNQQAMATSGGGSSSGVYTYQPPPQFEYVQGPAHHPGGGYTPQPQFEYVYAPAHNPGGGYTPEPQQTYVQTPQRQPGGGEYTPAPQTQYVYNPRHQPSVGDSAQPQMEYVPNKKPTSSIGSQASSPSTPTQQYDMSGKPLTKTPEELREISNSGMKRTVGYAASVVSAAPKMIAQAERGSFVGVLKSFLGLGRKTTEQIKDFADPTGRQGVVPPQGPNPAKRPKWLEDDLKKHAPDYPR